MLVIGSEDHADGLSNHDININILIDKTKFT